MTITNIFDAALCGDLEKIKHYYDGNINCVNESTKLNLLQTVVCGKEKYRERLDIISFLIHEGIDVNSQEGKDKQNALHLLYSSLTLKDEEFILSATKILVSAGIDVNQKDKFGAIPLSYLIAGKLGNSKIEPILIFLIESGTKCNEKDNYGNSCVDYAKQFSWREDILEIMKCTMNKEQLNVAQEAMIEWLADPQELGKRPSKIECAGEFEFNKMRYYIFKFKTGLFGKWLVGVCGGFEEGCLEPCGHTFSDMQEYNEATAQSKCIAMVEKIMAYWIEQAKKFEN